ncbi:MAG: hypothetical protein RIS35_1530 [Pseudomonadota bacterium]|jgi:Uma2 family endonuclease
MNAIVEPTRHRISIDDFLRMDAAGLFAPDARIELIEGDLIDMAPIGPPHGSLTNRLNRLLVRGAGDDAIVSVGNPLLLPPWSMPQPDFLLLRPRDDDYASRHPGVEDTMLAIEVADSSLGHDLRTKARVYAMHRVTEYWVVDVSGRRLHLHRDPSPAEGTWNTVVALEPPFRVAPAALPRLVVTSDDLWPPTTG